MSKAETYDPIPDLARLLCAAERLEVSSGGVEITRRRLYGALDLPELASADEAETAIRKALAEGEPAPHYHDSAETESCWCPSPGTYAPQGDGAYGSEEQGQ